MEATSSNKYIKVLSTNIYDTPSLPPSLEPQYRCNVLHTKNQKDRMYSIDVQSSQKSQEYDF